MEHIFLGIDLGTSAMKLVLIDEKRSVLAQVTEVYRDSQPDKGYHEIDPGVWYERMCLGIDRILDGFDRKLLDGIGVTGQMHTLVALDRCGDPVRPAMMWNDTRTKDLIPFLKEKILEMPEGEYLARTISTGSPAANLYWLSQNEPDRFARMDKFLIGPDYLVYRLTGVFGTDYCEASTSCLYQLKKRRWSPEMRELVGLRPEQYPQIRGSGTVVGALRPEMAARFSLREDVMVLAGTGDNPATAISTGCLGCGYPVISLGTSGVFMMPVSQVPEDAKGKIILFSFDGNDFSYLIQGVVQSNGSTFEWWVRDILGLDNFAEVDARMESERTLENELIFYPHLMGDKTLYADPTIRGAFIGLGAETSRYDMAYAVIEGLCFSFRELAEGMKLPLRQFGSIKVVGGGSRSRVWMQTMADVLQIKIEQMDGMIGPAFGIALLAAYRGGNPLSLRQLAADTVTVKECFYPDEKVIAAYDKKYERYRKVHRALQYIDG